MNNETENLNLYTSPTQTEPPKKKKNKRVIAAIVILVLAVIGLGSYVVYDKLVAKENQKETKKEETTKLESEPEENLQEIGEALMLKVASHGVDQLDAYERTIQFSATPSNEQLIGMAYYFWNQDRSVTFDNLNISKAQVDTYFKDAYGTTVTSYPSIICAIDNTALFTYDTNSQAYKPATTHQGHGTDNISSFIQKVYNIEKQGTNYVLTLNKVFAGNTLNSDGLIYSDGKYKNKINQLSSYVNGETGVVDESGAKVYYEQNYETLKELKPHYQYTYTKQTDGTFTMTKYEVIK